jgi:hypothetical protein
MSYRLTMFRFVALAVLSAFAIVALAFVIVLVTTPDDALRVFLVLWMAAAAWFAYWAVFRVAYEVGITAEGSLRWRSIAGQHELPISRIRGVSTPFRMFGAGLRQIEVAGARSPVLIASARGFGDVMAMVEHARPDLAIRSAWYDRLAARFGRSTMKWRGV